MVLYKKCQIPDGRQLVHKKKIKIKKRKDPNLQQLFCHLSKDPGLEITKLTLLKFGRHLDENMPQSCPACKFCSFLLQYSFKVKKNWLYIFHASWCSHSHFGFEPKSDWTSSDLHSAESGYFSGVLNCAPLWQYKVCERYYHSVCLLFGHTWVIIGSWICLPLLGWLMLSQWASSHNRC